MKIEMASACWMRFSVSFVMHAEFKEFAHHVKMAIGKDGKFICRNTQRCPHVIVLRVLMLSKESTRAHLYASIALHGGMRHPLLKTYDLAFRYFSNRKYPMEYRIHEIDLISDEMLICIKKHLFSEIHYYSNLQQGHKTQMFVDLSEYIYRIIYSRGHGVAEIH